MKLQGKLLVRVWRSLKDDKLHRALVVDMEYTIKVLSFKLTDIAEVLGLSVVEFVHKCPEVPGKVAVYSVEV